jgi:HEAT repeat protein
VSYLLPSQTITFEAALRDLATGSAKARAMAAHALGDVTDPAAKRRAIDALVRALDDDRHEVRAEAAASLGELGEAGSIPALIKRLDDGVPAVRQNAAIALGTLRHADGFEPLALALREGPADLRFQAATSLAEIDPARAYEPLVAALDDRDPQVVAAAALSLGALRDVRAVPLLGAKLDHRDAGTRFDVAYALAELGDASGRALLVAGLADVDRAWDAVDALGALGGADDVEALARALGGKKFPPEAQVAAAATILKLAPTGTHAEASRRVMLDALTSRKEYVRAVAVERLAEVGGAWAKAPLEKLARSGKGTGMHEAITETLRAIEGRS